jgi:YidC/Oxa1 family membrane protein insertase
MDRKGIIAVALAVLVLLLWQIEFAPKFTPPTPPPGTTPTPSASPAASGSPASAAGAKAPVLENTATISPAPAAPSAVGTPVQPSVPEQLTAAAGPAAQYHFTNLGGGIARAELTQYPAESGSNVDLNQFGTLPIGAVSDKPGEGADLPYTVTRDGNTVLCVRDQPGGLSIAKKFTLPTSTRDANGYGVKLDVTFTNHATQPVASQGYYLYVGSAAPVHQRDLPLYTSFDWFVQGGKATHTDVNYFNAGKIPLVGIETHPERPVYTMDADKIGWAAINGQFFTTVVAPQNGVTGSGVWAHRITVKYPDHDLLAIEGSLRMPAFTVPPGQSVTQSFQIYAGPKIYGVLQALGDGQERILNFGMFSYVSIFLLRTMNTLHSWTGSYAIAIIILTLCIRGVLWPIQNKATASMRQMQELQPRMTELKAKYKDDPTRMNTEVMKLYKEYNVNPLSGCIPMFVQIPIFFGFYRMLGTAIELRNSKFLWVHDLSQPDTVFHLAGYPVNILPICMAITMIVQMSMTPKSGDKSQQRMFMFMPLIFVMFCYNFASALALYWTVQNLFSITQLYVTRKRTAPAPFVKPIAKRKSR